MKKLFALLLVLTMVLTLTGCKKDDYESAVALMDAGSYAEAIVAFTELGDYEDSAQRLEECRNGITYAEAAALFEAGDYGSAYVIFLNLGDYRDSVQRCSECKAEKQNATAYEEAVYLFEKGAYKEARTLFDTIPDYRDVAEYLGRYQTVEITMDNWQEYFQLKAVYEWHENAFGEAEALVGKCGLFLKEEYMDSLNEAETNITFEIRFKEQSCEYEADFANRTYTWGSRLYSPSTLSEVLTISEGVGIVGSGWGEVNGKLHTKVFEDLELLRINGILSCTN